MVAGPGPHIETRDAWVEFPIFDAKSRSLKKAFLGKAGGTIGRNNSNVVVIEALRDITMSLELGDRVGLVGPQRRREIDSAAPAFGHLRTHPGLGEGHGPGRAGLRSRRRHGSRDLRLREHHHPRAVPRADPQADAVQGRRDRRVHRTGRLPVDAAAHLLHRDAGPAGDGRGHQHRPGDPAARRGHRRGGRRLPEEGAVPAAEPGGAFRNPGLRQPFQRIPGPAVQDRDVDRPRSHPADRRHRRRGARLRGRGRGAARARGAGRDPGRNVRGPNGRWHKKHPTDE